MINILASVRRPFSGFILDGKKPWELRKNAPRIPRGEHVTLWLYESSKDGERAKVLNTLPHHKQIHIAWDNPQNGHCQAHQAHAQARSRL